MPASGCSISDGSSHEISAREGFGRQRSRADKRSLFGDPTLVPTREGERMRREIAYAGELEATIAALPSVAQARVNVRSAADNAPHITVVAHTHHRLDASTLAKLKGTINGLGVSIVPRATPQNFVIALATPVLVPHGPRLAWPLALALLGLGVSLGVAAERIRGRSWANLGMPRPK